MPKPQPFTRPFVDLGSGVEREWRYVDVLSLQPEDTVANCGTLVSVSMVDDDIVEVVNAVGNTMHLKGAWYAYVPKAQEQSCRCDDGVCCLEHSKHVTPHVECVLR